MGFLFRFQNQRAKYRRNNSGKGDGTFNQQNLQLNSPDNGSTRQFSTPSPASIISSNSISNNQSTAMLCETTLPTNGSNSSLDQYSPSNSISNSILRQTPPPSVKMTPNSPLNANSLQLTTAALHNFGHITNSHTPNGLIMNNMSNRHLTNFNPEPILSTFIQDLY